MPQDLSAIPLDILPELCENLSVGKLTKKDDIAKPQSDFVLGYVAANSSKLLGYRAPNGRSVLHYIAAAGNEALLAVSQKEGADISSACCHGADWTIHDRHGNTTLHAAAANWDCEYDAVVRHIIQVARERRETKETIKLLLDNGCTLMWPIV
ncbi:uncharacterized protein AFUA_2G17280 [Aspergillus fumigatus Af293]|uniref:Ankyrin repeat protein n=2 Tax=Aspergillus fumigatus TaxID=746128 RepID=Q4WZE1_ASPFU|nr:hypothetical protein AFUA_2G17280 [Aspergillus fumigatus Af293]EAL94024.1 hypothetical protein AFUA_2G17280 [Aspergillus fumigatus Af293]EDP55229.1 hypothetical protein AFUB_032930 [Aspergillus fumigatus A1163]KEY76564.1 hypothetical protein BA78_8068 [Aspergillus fumigatus]